MGTIMNYSTLRQEDGEKDMENIITESFHAQSSYSNLPVCLKAAQS